MNHHPLLLLSNLTWEDGKHIRVDLVIEDVNEMANMDEKSLWQVVFVVVILIGVTIILLNPQGLDAIIRDGYRLMSIFLGMLAGTALGEVFKIRNNEKTGQGLLGDLVEELRINKELLKGDVKLRKGFWILGIRSGLVRHLPSQDRRILWKIYGLITHYQEAIEVLHKSKLLGKYSNLTTEFHDHITSLRQEITKRIDAFFQDHPPEEVSVQEIFAYPPELSAYKSLSNDSDV